MDRTDLPIAGVVEGMLRTPFQTLTPATTAEALGVSAQTVRRWASAYADHLSEAANPTAASVPRRFTQRDVDVLRHVKELRSQGLPEVNIQERLAGLAFGEVTTPSQAATEAPTQPAEAPGSLQLPAVVLDSLVARLDAAERASERAARDRFYIFAWGFVAGLAALAALMMIMLALASLAR